jgi:hypothetical protein
LHIIDQSFYRKSLFDVRNEGEIVYHVDIALSLPSASSPVSPADYEENGAEQCHWPTNDAN